MAALGVGGEKHTVDVQLKQLFVVSANARWQGRGDDRGLQVPRGIDRLCSTPHEELVVDIFWRKSVKSEPGIAAQIAALGRTPKDVRP